MSIQTTCTYSFTSLFQIAIDINRLLYNDLPIESLAERLKKAKSIAGVTQKELEAKNRIK